jgi:hypothetical protein
MVNVIYIKYNIFMFLYAEKQIHQKVNKFFIRSMTACFYFKLQLLKQNRHVEHFKNSSKFFSDFMDSHFFKFKSYRKVD